MKLIVDIPDAHAQDVLDAFTAQHRYRPNVLVADPQSPKALVAQPNPETPQAFVERLLTEHVRGVLRHHRQSLIVLPPVEF